jgi:ribulose 1,5-bisphosphate synthetase/thiazole synthase
MVNQNWWITTLMIKEHEYCPPLTKDIKCDVLIVGGGFSGISAARQVDTLRAHEAAEKEF